MSSNKIKKTIVNLRNADGNYDRINVYTFENAIEAIEQMIKERDEARYMFCHLASKLGRSVTDIADVLGWDCYKKEETK